MPGSTISQTELLRRVIDSRLGDVWTVIVASVVSVPEFGYVDVQPQSVRALPSEDDLDVLVPDFLPVVPNVRVAYLVATGGISIVFPVEVGSIGLLLVETMNSDQFLDVSQVDPVNVGDARLHHPGNAKFLPCLTSNKTIPTIDAGTLTLSAPMVKIGGPSASDFVALASKVDEGFAKVTLGFTGLVAGPNPVTGPNIPLSIDPTAATKVKAL